MTILRANLRHLYQRRGFWIIDLILFGGMLWGLAAAIAGKAHPIAVVPTFACLAGLLFGAQQVEILSRPFTFCLPGHSRAPARVLLWCGWGLAGVWAAMALLYPGIGIAARLLGAVSVFSAGTVLYWIAVWAAFRFQNWAWAFFLLIFSMLGAVHLNDTGGLGRMLMDVRLLAAVTGCAVVLGLAANAAAWRMLTRPGLPRRYCGRMWLGALDPWNRERMMEFSRARMAQKGSRFGVRPGVERFFTARIRAASPGARCVWGNLYRLFGMTTTRNRRLASVALVWVAVAAFLGYTGAGVNFLFVMPGLMVMQLELGTHSKLLTTGGRRERFWSALAAAVATAVTVTAAVTAIAAMTLGLGRVMPEVAFGEITFVYAGADLKLFVVPLGMIPVTLSIALIFFRHPRLMLGAVMAVFVLLQMTIGAGTAGTVHGPLIEFSDPAGSAAVILACWAIFVAVLGYTCARRNLVR